MMRGLYMAAAGMIAQQRKHDAAVNNIANANTPGYKAVTTTMRTFPEALLHAIRTGDAGRRGPIGRLATGVFAEEYVPLFVQGDLASTGRATDLAILADIRVDGLEFDAAGRAVNANGETVYQPQAFFTVANENGDVRFTRNGQFTVNAAGEWLTPSGMRLLGTNGQPVVTAGIDAADIQVTAAGLLIDRRTGEPVIGGDGEPVQILVSVVEQPYNLIREGNGVFVLENPAEARALQPGENVRVMQGYTERSNVDPLQATVDMMTALRMYEANQQVIQTFDRTLDKTVNDIGRL
jgi:flagellar basal-body rod protein FlgG